MITDAQKARRQQVVDFFRKTAVEDNSKNQPAGQDFWSVIDKTTGKKRGLFVIKESIGDIIIISSLFRSFHEQHPNTDLYVAADTKYHELLVGNPLIFKVLSYIPAMEQEMSMVGTGQKEGFFDFFYHPAIQTQRLLSYLSQPTPAFNLSYAESN
jgi:hypothetical protein